MERDLDEVASDERFDVLLALGRLEVLAGRRDALRHLRAAAECARTPAQAVRAAVSLGRVLRYTGAGNEAVELLEAAAVGLGEDDSSLAALVEQELLAASTVSYGARRRLAARSRRWSNAAARPPESFRDRFLLAAQAVESVCRGDDVAEAVELAGTALATELPNDHLGRHVRLLGMYAFLLADRHDLAAPLLEQLAEIAEVRGGAEMFANAAAQRALVTHRRGDLLAAEAEVVDALGLVAELGSPPAFVLTAAGALTSVAIERGEPPHPLAAGARDDGDSLFGRHLNHARAVQHVAERRLEQGVDALLAVGERELSLGWAGPSQFAWRSEAALALDGLGRTAEARRLAGEELRLATASHAPRALGVALRAAALLAEDDRVEGLRAAVALLEHASAELEHARALVDLGAALRLTRRPGDARAPLQRGYERATNCGATLLAKRAHDELRATGRGRGGRPCAAPPRSRRASCAWSSSRPSRCATATSPRRST